MGVIILAPPPSPLGATIPSSTPHAVSVSLPTWQDNIDYEEGAERVSKAMKSGYPRFYIHHQIDQLAQITAVRFGQPLESCMLFPSAKTSADCQAFLASRTPKVESRLVQYPITQTSTDLDSRTERTITIYATFYLTTEFSKAKEFWQHTGDGISSRMAERCLIMLGAIAEVTESEELLKLGRGTARNRHYVAKSSANSIISPTASGTTTPAIVKKSTGRYGTARSVSASSASTSTLPPFSDSPPASTSTLFDATEDEDVLSRYVEERYGRNLDISLAPVAKLAMRRRIAGVLRESTSTPPESRPSSAGANSANRKQSLGAELESSRGVEGLTENDVWLYPCGMSAIYHAHQLVMNTRRASGVKQGKSVCFGFPYTDTLKILQKFGAGVHFLGSGLSSDLPELRALLATSSPPILAIFCEFPSNPLLRSPPLKELRELATEFGAMIVVDETIAGFVNVEVAGLADVVCSSLTKVFSGDSNVMGGSLVISPSSPFYSCLLGAQAADYEDVYFPEDAIYMERNSRDFQERVVRENYNALLLCDYFRTRRADGPYAEGMVPVGTALDTVRVHEIGRKRVVKEIYYPKFMTPSNYEACMRPPNIEDGSSPGYGGLFSLTFTSILASSTFFDNLPCYKGPSLGTNFTLACPYTLLAHYTETVWAKEWGVEIGLVRISTGLEESEMLLGWFQGALEAAEIACEKAELLEQFVEIKN